MGRVEKSIEIGAPLEECYRVLSHFEEMPRLMKNVEQVRRKGDPNVWQWRVRGPEGHVLTWDIEILGMRHRNNVISWHTLRDSDVAHSGAITLEKLSENRTCLNFVMEYREDVGAIDELGALDPGYLEESIQASLECFKEQLEERPAVVRPRSRTQESTVSTSQHTISPDDIPYSI